VKRAAFWFAVILGLAANELSGADVIPPKPARYFNDYAARISQSATEQFDQQLARFERDVLNQIVVAILPKMQSEHNTVTRAQRVAESNWIHIAIASEDTGIGKTMGQEHRKLHWGWLLLFFGFLLVLSLLFGLHRTARRGVSYSKAGAHWTIDWRDVLFFWLDLVLSGGGSGRDSDGSSSSGSRYSGAGGSFGGGGAGSSW